MARTGFPNRMKTLSIRTLGQAVIDSPLGAVATSEDVRVPAEVQWTGGMVPADLVLFEKAGPEPGCFLSRRRRGRRL